MDKFDYHVLKQPDSDLLSQIETFKGAFVGLGILIAGKLVAVSLNLIDSIELIEYISLVISGVLYFFSWIYCKCKKTERKKVVNKIDSYFNRI